MPSRKQRRRRAKERRHDYEYVYVDDEGREVEVDAEELEQSRRNGKAPDGGGVRGARSGGGRSARAIQPPSWRRVAKRGLIFAPLMFITVALLSPDFTTAQKAVQTFFLLAVFLPFSYVMDSLTYRMYQRRSRRGR